MKDAALLLGISARQFKGFAAERKEGAAHAIQNAFYYKYEESKKSFSVIPKPKQILSIVSTLN